eukprot:1146160-Rhodomonas_salina.2
MEGGSPALPLEFSRLLSLQPHLLFGKLLLRGRFLMVRAVCRLFREQVLLYAKGMRLCVRKELAMPEGARWVCRLLEGAFGKVAFEVIADSCAMYCLLAMLDTVDDLTVKPRQVLFGMGYPQTRGFAHAEAVRCFLGRPGLRRLCVTGPHFADEALKGLMRALEAGDGAPCATLEVLELIHVLFKYDDFSRQWQRALAALPKFPALRHLHVQQFAYGLPAGELGWCVAAMGRLQCLELVLTDLQGSLEWLLQGLQDGGEASLPLRLTVLVVFECQLAPADFGRLPALLRLMPSLVGLHLIKLKMPRDAFGALGAQVASLTALERLRIGGITEEEQREQDLVQWLGQCRRLEELAIDKIKLTNATLAAVITRLAECPWLHTLNISRTVADEDPAAGRGQQLGELLASLSVLTTLVARGNNLTLNEQEEISRRVKRNEGALQEWHVCFRVPTTTAVPDSPCTTAVASTATGTASVTSTTTGRPGGTASGTRTTTGRPGGITSGTRTNKGRPGGTASGTILRNL